jgi:hypothetical protein
MSNLFLASALDALIIMPTRTIAVELVDSIMSFLHPIPLQRVHGVKYYLDNLLRRMSQNVLLPTATGFLPVDKSYFTGFTSEKIPPIPSPSYLSGHNTSSSSHSSEN